MSIKRGYTLVEVIVILFILTVMFVIVLSVFQTAISQLNTSRAKIVAVELANEQMEIIKNLKYSDVGISGGSPNGTIAGTRQLIRSNINFTIATSIQYVDDPFDGCVGETTPYDPNKSRCADGTIVDKPRDIPANSGNPADYKKANVEITWSPYFFGKPVHLSTIIAPKGLEGDTTKGFMMITVVDISGEPVVGASVQVINNALVPAFDHTFTTDSFGTVQLLDLEPAANSYVIKASKNGYYEARTCSIDASGTGCSDSEGNPDPNKRNLSISAGQLEEEILTIDRLSTLTVNSYDQNCVNIPNINLTLQGKKTISKPPSSILKNSINFITNGSGLWEKTDLEDDLYNLIVNTAGYDIAGVNHDLALNVLPNTNTILNILLASHTTNSLLLTAKDNTGTNLSGAIVRLRKTGYDETKITGHGFAQQTDWLGGSGQDNFIDDSTKYYSDNGNIDNNSSGQITLKKNSGLLNFSETFSTNDFKDAVNTTADWNTLDEELKLPTSAGKYPINTDYFAQTNKLNAQHGKIISATLNASTELNGQTVNYLLSADGGTNYELVSLGVPYEFVNVGSDLRWRAILSSTQDDKTPVIADFSINYNLEYFDANGELVSSTFDLGSAATFTTINWEPSSQPAATGAESLKFQIASNNDGITWNFTGPDGTADTFYTTNNATIYSGHNGNKYMRYKAILSTSDTYYSPSLINLRIGYTLACLPPGQVYFGNLDSDTYSVEVRLDGYEIYTANIEVSGYISQNLQMSPIP